MNQDSRWVFTHFNKIQLIIKHITLLQLHNSFLLWCVNIFRKENTNRPISMKSEPNLSQKLTLEIFRFRGKGETFRVRTLALREMEPFTIFITFQLEINV